jgi:6-phosphogluconolactonase
MTQASSEPPRGGKPWGVVTEFVAPHLEVTPAADWVPRAADVFEFAIRSSIEERGRCIMAISGGNTPAAVFQELSLRPLSWSNVVLVQVDERMVSIGSGQRNLTQQLEAFQELDVRWLPLPIAEPIHDGIQSFLDELHHVAGERPILDVVHLGLGDDGHTASLIPGDPVLDVMDVDVATTGVYRGNRRVTLTRPILDRARLVVWLLHGPSKRPALAKLLRGDQSIPAGLIRPQRAIVIADEQAVPTEGAEPN